MKRNRKKKEKWEGGGGGEGGAARNEPCDQENLLGWLIALEVNTSRKRRKKRAEV